VFGRPISEFEQAEIAALTQQLFEQAPLGRELVAGDFLLEGNPARVVAREIDVQWPDGRVRVARSEQSERPPFEWNYEVTSDIGEVDYFKHYLVRDHDIVLAQRKILTPIDQDEAVVLRQDLRQALGEL
jgi:hypothetical protein